MNAASPDLVARAKEVFADALERPAADRASFIEGACAGDVGLRSLVDALLTAHGSATRFMHSPSMAAVGATGSSDAGPPVEGPGTVVGRYKVLELIGEGGFGTVFLAEQREPLVRRVALKVIKLGMDTRQVIARFEAERQALAMMDHPNIARVFDAGATDAGRPYFVMELVRGNPVTQYCDNNNLGVRERLELFEQVCHAVQHAHQKGIIHRDLKPRNVLVTVADGKPIPKVIDFGIAKATSARLTEKTLFTEHRALIGTPEYMSPEQAEMSAVDIDTRSDIYSLGVLLYELLTGTTPFDAKHLRNAAPDEIKRIIREVEPPRPSTRLSTMKGSLTSVAAHRRSEPARLPGLVRGDLDWIVMKCLEKDRTRRYDTADGLALDVRRHLAGEPVLAAPPGRAYRIRKFVRRHRVGVLAGGLVAGALVLGLAGTTTGFVQALAQRDRAVLAEQEQARERERAERQRDKAERIAAFMEETLRAVRPSVAVGRDTAVLREMMDRAAERMERGELGDAPEAEFRLRLAIGDTYREIAAYDAARAMLEPAEALARSLASAGGESPEVVDVLTARGYLLHALGRDAEAEPLHRQALDMSRRLYTGDHERTATALNNVATVTQELHGAAESQPLYEQSVSMWERLFSGDHEDLATALNNLAFVREALGRPAEAEPLLVRALDMRRRLFTGDHPDVAANLNNLAAVRQALGRAAEAEPLYHEALDMRRRLYAGDHPEVATALSNLGFVRHVLGRTAEAESLYGDSLDMRRRLFGGDHPDIAGSLNNLAFARMELGRPGEAEPLFQEAVEMHRRLQEGDHPALAGALSNLGRVQLALGRAAEAEPLFRQALEMRQRLYTGDHQSVAWSLNNLGGVLLVLGRASEAEPLYRQGIGMAERVWPTGHPRRARMLKDWAEFLRSQDRLEEARAAGAHAVDMAAKFLAPEHPDRKAIEALAAELGVPAAECPELPGPPDPSR